MQVVSLVLFLEDLQVLIDKIKNINFCLLLTHRFIPGRNLSFNFARFGWLSTSFACCDRLIITNTVTLLSNVLAISLFVFFLTLFAVLSLQFSSDSVAQHKLYVKEHKVRAEKSSHRPLDRTLFVLNIPPYCSEVQSM